MAERLDLYGLVTQYLRTPTSWATTPDGTITATFQPPLSPAEQATFDDLQAMSVAFVPTITLAEWQAIKTDTAGLATYQNLASPTLAQTVLAVKAQSRILKALLRS